MTRYFQRLCKGLVILNFLHQPIQCTHEFCSGTNGCEQRPEPAASVVQYPFSVQTSLYGLNERPRGQDTFPQTTTRRSAGEKQVGIYTGHTVHTVKYMAEKYDSVSEVIEISACPRMTSSKMA